MYDELKEKETATTKFKDDILKFDNQFKYDEKTNFTKFVFVGMGPVSLLGALSLIEKEIAGDDITICDYRDKPFERNNNILVIFDFYFFPIPEELKRKMGNIYESPLMIKINNLQIILYHYLKEKNVNFVKIDQSQNDIFDNVNIKYVIDGTGGRRNFDFENEKLEQNKQKLYYRSCGGTYG